MKNVIWSSTIEAAEFEEGWKSVIKEFELEDNRWLTDMYDMRESWIPAYFRDKPMYGLIRTTSRSESENFFFSNFHQSGSSLCQFYIRFESAMDKQRSETKRLNHECRSGKPALVSKLYLEDDASELYTRSVFYKVQEEILAARDDMRIQSIGPETNGIKTYVMKDVKMKDVLFQVKVSKSHADCSCKKFLLCGILCRHAFCALNHFEVVKIPRRLVLNRWMKNAENKVSLKMFGVSDDQESMGAISKELTNLWFNFHKCVTKAGNDLDKLKQVNKSIQGLNSELGDASGGFTKQDFMANLIGKRPTGDISIQPPLQCKNKGSGLKRIVGEREKAINQAKKNARKCKLCSSTFHDQRTCPTKKKFAES
nr:PREDICTED: protein FAR1-RELATED SEQUENCE 9-like [Daucus carota subsp. sativus]